jgi:integrase
MLEDKGVTVEQVKRVLERLKLGSVRVDPEDPYTLIIELSLEGGAINITELQKKKERVLNAKIKGIKKIKRVMRYAEDKDHAVNSSYKSTSFKAPQETASEIYLNEEELSQIRALELSHEQHSLALTRDLFIIGAYSGLRVSDYNRLTNDNLHTHNGSEMLEVRCQLFTSIDKSSYGRYLWSFRSCYISTICYP